MELYRAAKPEQRTWLNQAIWEQIRIGMEGETDRPGETEHSVRSEGAPRPVMTAVRHAATPERATGTARTPAVLSLGEGSNVNNVAVTVGFEPITDHISSLCRTRSSLIFRGIRPFVDVPD
ncbi:MAG: hypothetical protein ACK5MR_13820 [Cumulibacter sp.]